MADALDLRQSGRIGDERGGAGIRQAVFQRLRAEQARQRQGDGAELVGSGMGDHDGGRLGQKHTDAVAGAQAEPNEGLREAVRRLAQASECRRRHRPRRRDIVDRRASRLDPGPAVADIDADIEPLGDVPGEARHQGIVIGSRFQHGGDLTPAVGLNPPANTKSVIGRRPVGLSFAVCSSVRLPASIIRPTP